MGMICGHLVDTLPAWPPSAQIRGVLSVKFASRGLSPHEGARKGVRPAGAFLGPFPGISPSRDSGESAEAGNAGHGAGMMIAVTELAAGKVEPQAREVALRASSYE